MSSFCLLSSSPENDFWLYCCFLSLFKFVTSDVFLMMKVFSFFLLTPTKSVCHLTKEKDLLKQKEFSIKWFCSLPHTLTHILLFTHTHTHTHFLSLSLFHHTRRHTHANSNLQRWRKTNRNFFTSFCVSSVDGWLKSSLTPSLSKTLTHLSSPPYCHVQYHYFDDSVFPILSISSLQSFDFFCSDIREMVSAVETLLLGV